MGFIHADIKPDNILLGSNNANENESNKIYLIDYGLSCSYIAETG